MHQSERAYFDFRIDATGDPVKNMAIVGLVSKSQIRDTKYGSYYYSEAMHNDSKRDEVRGYCELSELEGFMTSLAKSLRDVGVSSTYRSSASKNVPVVIPSDLMGKRLTQKEVEFLDTQGFERIGDTDRMYFNTKKKRGPLPIVRVVRDDTRERVVLDRVVRGNRQSLTAIVDTAILAGAVTKNEIINSAKPIYPEKTEQQLRVTITSLLATAPKRHNKVAEHGIKNNEKTYHLK